jgi:TRAP-type mannitol/chloroaromatic compound transport system permease large subunit
VRRLREGQSGQAVVELVALVPVLVVLLLVLGSVLLSGAAAVAAEGAVGRGIAAGAAGDDPVAAARRALPRALARNARVRVERGRLVVTVDVPGVAPARRATAPLLRAPAEAAP